MCGKNGKTYQNECLAKCAKVEINSQKACPANTEAMAVWQKFKKAKSEWINTWQKSWDASARNPIFGQTSKAATSNTKTAYKFEFANKCVAHIVYDSSTSSTELGSASCPSDKCSDAKEISGPLVSLLKIPPKCVTYRIHLCTQTIAIYPYHSNGIAPTRMCSRCLQLCLDLQNSGRGVRVQVRPKPT